MFYWFRENDPPSKLAERNFFKKLYELQIATAARLNLLQRLSLPFLLSGR